MDIKCPGLMFLMFRHGYACAFSRSESATFVRWLQSMSLSPLINGSRYMMIMPRYLRRYEGLTGGFHPPS